MAVKHKNYLFTSARLGFRNWHESDVSKMIQINADPEAMEYFPSIANEQKTISFVKRMRDLYANKAYCYFAVDELQTGDFIGFIGLSEMNFEAPFTPCVDVGWRLSKQYWGKGYATEGSKRCLKYGFNELKLTNIKSTAPIVNQKSIRVMEKIGMKEQLKYKHPLLLDNKRLVDCVCYELESDAL